MTLESPLRWFGAAAVAASLIVTSACGSCSDDDGGGGSESTTLNLVGLAVPEAANKALTTRSSRVEIVTPAGSMRRTSTSSLPRWSSPAAK